MPTTAKMLKSSFYALSYYVKLIQLFLTIYKLFSNNVLSKLGFKTTMREIYNKYTHLKLFRCYNSLDLWSSAFITQQPCTIIC